tara:strand:+ start:35 stop:220 length:186 start_codon:yes stop_codon:yes gene_type:complete
MGIIKDFKCIICETKFDVDAYDDAGLNKCPKCDQVYNYDEGLQIELTEDQKRALTLDWCSA